MKIYLFDWCLAKPPDGVAVQTESDNIVVDHLEVRKEFLDAISELDPIPGGTLPADRSEVRGDGHLLRRACP